MALIDSNNFITHLVWSGLIDKATCGELKDAIELCTVKDIYTKDEVIAMFKEIMLEIEEYSKRQYNMDECISETGIDIIIQDKIDKLQEDI